MKPNRARILLADDSPANLLTVGRALGTEFDVQVATDGQQALELAARTRPDLILLDVLMPVMDGHEACRRLKASPELKDVPVLFLTGLSDAESETAGLALGAADYITKPINLEVARQRIRNLLERERLRKELEAHRDHLEELVAERTASLITAKEEAESASRAKSAFLATVGHELRTPLNAIIGFTELVRRRVEDSKQRGLLDKVIDAARHLLDLLTEVLDYTRLEANRLTLDEKVFTFPVLLQKIIGELEPLAARKGVAFTAVLAPELSNRAFLGDPMRLGQIIRDLLANAVSFTEHGSIDLAIRCEEEEENTVYVRCEVRDTGSGVPQEFQAALFSPFQQADASLTRSYKGTGMGLAICKRLASVMGGDLGFSSQVGQGSTFWFTARFQKA